MRDYHARAITRHVMGSAGRCYYAAFFFFSSPVACARAKPRPRAYEAAQPYFRATCATLLRHVTPDYSAAY